MNRGLLSLKLSQLLKSNISLVNDPMMKGAALLYPEVVLSGSEELMTEISEELSIGGESDLFSKSMNCFRSVTSIPEVSSTFYTSDVLKEIDQFGAKNTEVNKSELSTIFGSFFRSSPSDRGTHEVMSIFLSLRTGAHFHAHPDELRSMQALFQKEDKSFVSEHRPIAVSIPDLSLLTWRDVFELRDSPYIEKYRNFLSTFHLSDGIDQSLVNDINQSLWTALGYSKPTAGGSSVKRILSNIPIPIPLAPNPYAVYRDITEASKERESFLKYGWLWFIQEARSVTSERHTV
jgi:hypothetical protein